MTIVGVLALQGGFAAHMAALERAGVAARAVREPADLMGLGGLVLPGGESTVQLRLLHRHRLNAPVAELVASGVPVLCTCAGLILAARAVTPAQPSFGWLDVAVDRNAWGPQIDSFEARSDDGLRHLVFIRAPRITQVGPGAVVLSTFRGEPVLVRQGHVFGATFHPELTRHDLHAELFGGLGSDARDRL